MAGGLNEKRDYRVVPSERTVEITDEGRLMIEQSLWEQARVWTTSRVRDELVRQALPLKEAG